MNKIAKKAEKKVCRDTVVIVIHLYYLDTINYYFKYIKNIPEDISVFFTASDYGIKKALENEQIIKKNNWKIIDKQNRGRDISAFLVACRKELLKYEYVCFLHDKKEKNTILQEDTKQWIICLWENMIGSSIYIDNILTLFSENERLGVLVPPLPISAHHNAAYANAWHNNFYLTRDLAETMNLICDLRMEKPPITIGTVFWARVSALKKLFEIEWKYENFDKEPLKNNGTISHAVERILAYVAQDAGYETGCVMTDYYAGKRFEYMQEILRSSFDRLEKSLGIRTISELDSYEERLNEMIEFVEKYEEFYIYGVGIEGKRCMKMLKDVYKFPNAFLVSEIKENPRDVMGIPVYCLSQVQINETCGIIIGTSVKYQEEIMEKIRLQNPWFSNIYLYRSE